MDELKYQVDFLTAMNQKVAAEEKIYRDIIETSNRAFIYVQSDTGLVRTMGRFDDFFDIRPTHISELRKMINVIDDSYRDVANKIFWPEQDGKTESFEEIPLNGMKQWLEVHTSVVMNDDGSWKEKIITFRDITKHHAYKDELMYMAYYDALTGLYNRNYFITQLNEFVEKANAENNIVSVILIDIDDFHKINDSLGIIMGDEVVQNVGLYIKSLLSDNVIAARFDGDLYAVAIYDPVGSRSADGIYNSLKEFLNKPMLLSDTNEVSLTVSCGVADYPEASESALSLVNFAEIVMLKAKDGGKNSIKYFDTEVLSEFIDNVLIERRLKEAVSSQKFFLNFQPQYNASDRKLRGFEALIRWKDDEGKFVSPAKFIPLAEKSGTIISIGDWVMEEAIKTHMEWKRKFDLDLILSINISAIQYRKADFVSKIISLLKRYNMSASELELEITESVLIDDLKLVIEKMEELRDYGIRVSIDDFGTGYSSLSYLKGLPVDTIKIDKSFVDTVLSDSASKIIMDAIVNLAKNLGYELIAEGVESEDQFDYLNSIKCDMIQGYYLGKPVSKEAVEDMLLRLI